MTSKDGTARRDPQDALEEAKGLAHAIDLDIIEAQIVKIASVDPGHFIGKGRREWIGHALEGHPDAVVFINHALSPVQQRNLEKQWARKVIDRTGLIIDIFGSRAQTKEGRLQVELAALEYRKSRIVKAWSHLERQRGGGGFIGGPGETQKELDRRMIGERIIKLKKEIEDVRRTRLLSHKGREKVPFPVIALVGYTNAGKSTLFNALTGEKTFAKDLLFATLDPMTRRIDLPNGQSAVVSDTVGFISDLPTHLVTSFRATLEHIALADVIVHVMDVSNPDFEGQSKDVVQILQSLGIDYDAEERILEAWNKRDRIVDSGMAEDLARAARFKSNVTLISAVSGQGLDELKDKIAHALSRERITAAFLIPASDGKAAAWLHEHGQVIAQAEENGMLHLRARLSKADAERFKGYFGYLGVFDLEE